MEFWRTVWSVIASYTEELHSGLRVVYHYLPIRVLILSQNCVVCFTNLWHAGPDSKLPQTYNICIVPSERGLCYHTYLSEEHNHQEIDTTSQKRTVLVYSAL